jgi:hypothetical protein
MLEGVGSALIIQLLPVNVIMLRTDAEPDPTSQEKSTARGASARPCLIPKELVSM